MRSYDAAFKAGSSIGRTLPDLWISDLDLRRVIARDLGPDFNPVKTRAQGSGERWSSGFATCCTFTVIIIAVAIVANMPDLLPSGGAHVLRQLLVYVPVSLINSVCGILVFLTVILGWYAARKRRLGRESRERVVGRLADAALAGATDALNRRRSRQGVGAVRPASGQSVGVVAPGTPQPLGRDVDHLEAERVVCQWMRALGETSAQLTQVTGDGGIDVEGFFYIAQVKHFSAAVGPGPIREMNGVAHSDPRGRKPLFFTKTGYSSGAVEEADRSGIGLFVYDTYSGTLNGANALGRRYRQTGLR